MSTDSDPIKSPGHSERLINLSSSKSSANDPVPFANHRRQKRKIYPIQTWDPCRQVSKHPSPHLVG